MWRNVLGCGEVWGEEKGDVGEVREVGKMGRRSHIPYISPHFSHTPTHIQHTSPHLPPHLFSHLPPHFCTPTPTLPHSFHIPPILDPTPQTTKTPLLPHHPYCSKFFITPILPHTPSPPYYHCYFIIYPTPKLLTFLIYCQINPAITCTRNSL